MYYKILAKCGHVGRNNYILKTFYVTAENGKSAASKVRQIPRVKHDHKDAIKSVTLISFDEFNEGLELNNNDLYFHMNSISEQRLYNAVDYEDIISVEENDYIKDRNIDYKIKKNKIIENYNKNQIKGLYCVAI